MSDLNKVKELRKATGAGFKDCNNALKESNGDLNKAIEILRIKGVSKASKKMSRSANEGLIIFSEDINNTTLTEINCETDFVAKNEDFLNFSKELGEINNRISSSVEKLKIEKMRDGATVEENIVNLISKIGEKITIGRLKSLNKKGFKNFKYLHTVVKDNLAKLGVIVSLETSKNDIKIEEFGKQLCMHIAASNPIALTPDQIEDELIEKEKELIFEQLKETGKPKEIIDKISVGKLNKFKEENSLLTQAWVMDTKKKVREILSELKVDDLKIKDFFRIKIGE